MPSFDIYAEVTSRILDQLDKGVIPWKKPWTGSSDGAVAHKTLRPYSLLNQILLGTPGEYLTLKQCNAEGGHVKKGAKSRFVVFWKVYGRQQRAEDGSLLTDDDGSALMHTVPLLRYYRVFHIDDCEGVTPRLKSPDDLPTISPVQRAEDVFAGYRARSGVKFELLKQDKAFYSPAYDKIVLPLLNQFSAAEEYYSVLFHEAVHSTGHKTRLNRFEGEGSASFGSETYSREELVAEIGSAAILHELGMETPETFRNSTAYVQGWSEKLRADPRLFICATARAEKAVRMIFGPSADAAEALDADGAQ